MDYKNLQFDVSEKVLALGLNGVYFTMGGLCNKDTDPNFDLIKSQVVNEILEGLSMQTIEENSVLAGFRSLHQRVNVSNRKNIASPENLLSFLLQRRQIPHINLLVDIYNLVSIKSKLALGAHDIKHISGAVHLRLTNGGEIFWPLGSDKLKPVGVGEYAYVDDSNEILCRLETRQVEKTKVTLETTECFYIIQGSSASDAHYLKAVAEELITLTKRFCGGEERFLFVSS